MGSGASNVSSMLFVLIIAGIFSSTVVANPPLLLPDVQVSTDPVDPESYYEPSANALANRQWLLQQQNNYESIDGGRALGKLLQRSLKASYKSFREQGHISRGMPDEEGNGQMSGIDYKLRLKSDTVKLGFQYKF